MKQLIMKQQRTSQKQVNKLKKVKTFCFDFLFLFTANSITNQLALLIIDLLQLLVIPYFYVNPVYEHLNSHAIFNFYFASIHPYLIHIRQNQSVSTFPIALFVYSLYMIILAILRKHGSNIFILILSFLFALLPVFIVRMVSQAVDLLNSTLANKLFGFMFLAISSLATTIVLIKYQKWLKIFDIVIAMLIIYDVNDFAIITIIGVKIIITIIFGPSKHAKYIKMGLQISLLFSWILLFFLKPVMINYIMIVVFISLVTIYSGFKTFIKFEYKDLSRVKIDQDDQYCIIENYTSDEVKYFQKINKHINECVILQCKCRQILDIKDIKQLKKWAPSFRKDQLKIIAFSEHSHGLNNLSKRQNQFNQVIQYIEACLETEQPDFYGFIKLHQLRPKSFKEQYKKYFCWKKYSLYLQKSTPKTLNMVIVNASEQSNPFDQIIHLQNKVCTLIQKIKLFWNQLLTMQAQSQFVNLIEQISDDINLIHKTYEKIEQNYDEKQQAQFYYHLFKLLVLHERPNAPIIDNHKTKYVMVTRGETIVNMTINITNLFQRARDKLIGHRYTKMMSNTYANQHSQWAKLFLNQYRPSEQNNFVKPLQINSSNIKVVHMIHLLVPSFGEQIEIEDDNGINVVSLIYRNSLEYQLQEQVNQFSFHFLVCRNTLDIVSFENQCFQFFGEIPNLENSNKIMRSNIKKIFPNLNRQALLNKGENPRRLVAKFNKTFFESQEINKLKQQTYKCPGYDAIDQPLKKAKDNSLSVSEVQSQKNQKLNLLLLKFQSLTKVQQKQIKGKKTSQDLQLDLLKKKTLKNIIQSTKQKKGKSKQSNVVKRLRQLLCVCFILPFFLSIAILLIFQLKCKQIEDLAYKLDKKSTFFTDLQYTKAFLLNFPIGENRIINMEKEWNYNQQYSDIITVFRQVDQLVFNQRFNEYVQYFEKVHSFQIINQQIEQENLHIDYIKKIVFILFYLTLLALVCNFIISMVIFIKIILNSIEILSSFLRIQSKQIQSNLKRIGDLEILLELNDFQTTFDSENIKQQSEGTLNPLINRKLQSVHSLALIDNMEGKRKRVSLKEQKKINFDLVLNNYLQQNSINAQKQGPSTSLSKLDKNKRSRYRPNNKPAKNQIPQKKSQRNQQNDESQSKNNQQLTITNSVIKNYGTVMPALFKFLLKLCMCLMIIFFTTTLLSQTIKCIKLKQRFRRQESLILQNIQATYFQTPLLQQFHVVHYFFYNTQLIKDMPAEFSDFAKFAGKFQSSDKTICQYLDKSKNLYLECQKNKNIFKSGIQAILQFIDQRLRKVSIGTLSKEILKQYNEVTLAAKVYIEIVISRNAVFDQAFKKYLAKYAEIKKIIQILSALIFTATIYLHFKQIKNTEQKTKKTQNLFKIVPPFMKSRILQQNVSK